MAIKAVDKNGQQLFYSVLLARKDEAVPLATFVNPVPVYNSANMQEASVIGMATLKVTPQGLMADLDLIVGEDTEETMAKTLYYVFRYNKTVKNKPVVKLGSVVLYCYVDKGSHIDPNVGSIKSQIEN